MGFLLLIYTINVSFNIIIYLWASLLVSLGFFFNFSFIFILLFVPFILPYVYNLQLNFNFIVFNLDRILMFLTLGRLYYLFVSTFMNYLYLFLLFLVYLFNLHFFLFVCVIIGPTFFFNIFFKMNIFLIRSF